MKCRFMSLAVAILVVATGCVSNKAIQTVQAGDDAKPCSELKAELTQLGVKFDYAKGDSGITGKNVGAAVLFWPAIIVNEFRASKNQDSIDKRLTHLTTIYNSKCTGGSEDGKLTERLRELKDLHDEDLIGDEEYEKSRKRALEQL
ncbi:MAG: hypothetical protein ACT4NX_05750 [Deltaproteobacteria bacterium]